MKLKEQKLVKVDAPFSDEISGLAIIKLYQIYQRMLMGLNISPSIWQSYINAILECLQSIKYREVIMDDLLLFTPTKKVHISKLKDLLKALMKNGPKISPRKCQLFKTELQYMGNVIFIKDGKVCIKPLRSRVEAILKLNLPQHRKAVEVSQGWFTFLVCFVWNYKDYLSQYTI